MEHLKSGFSLFHSFCVSVFSQMNCLRIIMQVVNSVPDRSKMLENFIPGKIYKFRSGFSFTVHMSENIYHCAIIGALNYFSIFVNFAKMTN